MSWQLILAPSARRDVRRLDPQIRRRVGKALEQLAEDPRAANLKTVTGKPGMLSFRVGEWRVLLELDYDSHSVDVERVLPRGRAYRDL